MSLYRVDLVHQLHNIKAFAAIAADSPEAAIAHFKFYFESRVFGPGGFSGKKYNDAFIAAFWADGIQLTATAMKNPVARFEWDKKDPSVPGVFQHSRGEE